MCQQCGCKKSTQLVNVHVHHGEKPPTKWGELGFIPNSQTILLLITPDNKCIWLTVEDCQDPCKIKWKPCNSCGCDGDGATDGITVWSGQSDPNDNPQLPECPGEDSTNIYLQCDAEGNVIDIWLQLPDNWKSEQKACSWVSICRKPIPESVGDPNALGLPCPSIPPFFIERDAAGKFCGLWVQRPPDAAFEPCKWFKVTEGPNDTALVFDYGGIQILPPNSVQQYIQLPNVENDKGTMGAPNQIQPTKPGRYEIHGRVLMLAQQATQGYGKMYIYSGTAPMTSDEENADIWAVDNPPNGLFANKVLESHMYPFWAAPPLLTMYVQNGADTDMEFLSGHLWAHHYHVC